MEYRLLGGSGLQVPALTLGTGTFGGKGAFFEGFGSTQVEGATRLIDICLDHGLTMFDSADIYSFGAAEEILGHALKGKRHRAIISTKATFTFGEGPNNVGSSRHNLLQSVEGSLKRLQTDYIDLFQLHAFDAMTPVDEVLNTLDLMVKQGKIRYIGVSNFSGWHLMKGLAYSSQFNLSRYVAHQAFYSLVGREYEWELMPLAMDQKVGTVVWSPLGWGRLTGKLRRGQPIPEGTRASFKASMEGGPIVDNEFLYNVVDVLDEIAIETEKSIPQVALNWLLQRPTVSTLIFGARNEEQLLNNLGAVGWKLSPEQIARLDTVSERPKTYPYWHQDGFSRNPNPV